MGPPGLLLFLTQLTPNVLSSIPGTPLTEEEYDTFFSFQKPVWKANHLCQIRHSKGCNDPRIMPLDQFENHGEIPEGPICTDFPVYTRFENFCEFAQSRCLNHHFYARRIPCLEPPVLEEIIVVSSATSKAPDTSIPVPIETTSPSPEMRLRTNIDAILKYAFAVSGEAPVPRKPTPVPESILEILEPTTPAYQPELSSAQIATLTAEMLFSDSQKSEGTTSSAELVVPSSADDELHQSIHRLIAKAFSLEKSLNADKVPTDKDVKTEQEAASENSTSGSILSLDKNAALVILCYSVLQDICITTAVSKAWQEVEAKFFGYGDLVCDNFGRRHTNLCTGCAFCSLKIEQCQGTTNLKRTHCEGDKFSDYINPGILAQHKAMVPMITSVENEYYGIEDYGGLQTEYWCGRLATHGCDDYRAALWLQSEYSSFQGGDFPDKICDSEGNQHPTYCAFKSKQCLEYTLNKKKLFRTGCLKNETYNVLNKGEGEDEVLQWSEKFSSVAES
ncbi:acrosin-binding protein isoform X2 [Anolis carolinensis]|uniref:acrosin-binding protein isoform X2 n=1 Tax=Anolis carolinensis TaxID=28377 RepID=UPI002F2B3A07